MRVAIIGAGWAGMAAAVRAAQRGHQVSVFEASRQLGGRARSLSLTGPQGQRLSADNGQHILIGAYADCLALMRSIGVNLDTCLLRQPLALLYPDGSGLQLPNAAPPWDALWGIARARGWSWAERLALLRRAASWRLGGFRCPPGTSVAQLCTDLPLRLLEEFIDPLCISALNTPAHQACGQVFLRVLRDSLFAGRGGSNLLIARTQLGALLPEPAAAWLSARGHQVLLGQRVQSLACAGNGWQVDGQDFDAVLLATPNQEAARLCAQAPAQGSTQSALRAWAQVAAKLEFGAIATVYAWHDAPSTALPTQPMLALRPGPQRPAQFVFQHALLGGAKGLLAFVISSFDGDRTVLQQQVQAQAQEDLGLTGLHVLQTVVEKRATFLCTPGLQRPARHIAPGLQACADYVAGPYPATLEGAVRHGLAAAEDL